MDVLLHRNSDHRTEGDAQPTSRRTSAVEAAVAADRRTAAKVEEHFEADCIEIAPSTDGVEAVDHCCAEVRFPNGPLQAELWPRSIWVTSSSWARVVRRPVMLETRNFVDCHRFPFWRQLGRLDLHRRSCCLVVREVVEKRRRVEVRRQGEVACCASPHSLERDVASSPLDFADARPAFDCVGAPLSFVRSLKDKRQYEITMIDKTKRALTLSVDQDIKIGPQFLLDLLLQFCV